MSPFNCSPIFLELPNFRIVAGKLKSSDCKVRVLCVYLLTKYHYYLRSTELISLKGY
jgi:hypothetical protein